MTVSEKQMICLFLRAQHPPALLKQRPTAEHLSAATGFSNLLTWLFQTTYEGWIRSNPSLGSWVKWPYHVFQPAVRAAKIALVHWLLAAQKYSVPFETQPCGTVSSYANTETTKEQGHQTSAVTESYHKQNHPFYLKHYFLPSY